MTDGIDISGEAPAALIDAFADNFERGAELGARFAAMQDGEIIADIWAGHIDRSKQTPFTDETLCCIFSSGKAPMAFLMARAVSEGALDYDRPVADYWPDFAANGKETVTLAMALSHQAGLCGFPNEMPPEDWINWDLICSRLAAMAPLWAPGTASGYHPQTVGFIGGEILKRASGRSIGETLREDFFNAAGVDLHCGLTEAEMARVSYMLKPPSAPVHRQNSRYTEIAFLKPWSAPARVAREDWMAAELPASNMHGTARALAEIMHPLANRGDDFSGDKIVGDDAIRQALQIRITGEDLVLPFDLSWAAGLMANNFGQFGPSISAFGHAGFGGSCVVIDPEKRLSFAYVMNKMSPSLVGDERAVRLAAALYEGL